VGEAGQPEVPDEGWRKLEWWDVLFTDASYSYSCSIVMVTGRLVAMI